MELDKSVLDTPVFSALAGTSEKRYIFVCNMETNVSRWSRNAVEYFGLPGEYMYDVAPIWIEHVHPDDRQKYTESLDDLFSGRALVRDFDYRAENKAGEYVVCTCRGIILKGENGEPDLFAGTIENHGVTENIDANTGLYNIYEFWKRLHERCEKGECTSVLEIGINNFSDINDVHGYEAGNEILKKTAAIFLEIAGERGSVFRLDGVRFAFCFGKKDRSWLGRFYRTLQEEVRKKFFADGGINITLSGGAVICDGSADAHSIMVGSSYALAQSKYKHYGELIFFNDEENHHKKRNLGLLEVLRRCVISEYEGFYLCYQPIVSAEGGEVLGMEALLRWKGEPFGEVPPGEFVPCLENDTCFYELGNWILQQALKDAKKVLKVYPDFIVNVNVAYTQLERVGFVKSVETILKREKFPPENLCLELTERCRVLDKEYLKREIYRLKALGVQVAIDDFGTGFSSLTLLKDLPVDTLKIDREFIMGIEQKFENQAIVESIIQCANTLGVKVCVEGIENQKLIEFMKKYGVHSYQGYYYSKPVEIEEFLQKYV